jgi:hypothetical protein
MFSFAEKDRHRMPQTTRTYLPLKTEGTSKDEDLKKVAPGSGSVFDDNDPRENEVHPELQRLPSTSLKGTFLQAYLLLNEICKINGWDELLRHRSVVVVMEEEYRIHRAIQEEEEKRASVGGGEDENEFQGHPNAPPLPGSGDEAEFHDAESGAGLNLSIPTRDDFDLMEEMQRVDEVESSLSPLTSPLRDAITVSPVRREEFDIVDLEDGDISTSKVDAISSPMNVDAISIPIVNNGDAISSPLKAAEVELYDVSSPTKETERVISPPGAVDQDEFSPVDMSGLAIDSDDSPRDSVKSDDTIGKSLNTGESIKRASYDSHDDSPLASRDMRNSGDGLSPLSGSSNRQSVSYNNFRRKRLCEKWLDNLFMVLYNDLRLYTALKQVLGG